MTDVFSFVIIIVCRCG